MLLDDDVAHPGLKTSRTTTEVEDELSLVKLNFVRTILSHNVNELENILSIFECEATIVAQRVGVIGHIRILVDLDGGACQLHVGGNGDAYVIGLALLYVQWHTVDSALGLPLGYSSIVGRDGIYTVGIGEARVSNL